MNKISSKHFDLIIEIVILLVVFLVPTIFDRRLGIVFSGTKVTFMRSLGIVLLSLWAMKLVIFKKHHFTRTVLDWPVVSFLLCTTIATLTSVHVYTSFVGFYGRYEGLTTWYLYGLFFFVVTNYMKSFEQLKRIVMMVLAAAAYMAIYSVIQRHSLDPYMWGGVVTWQRVIGTIGQPNFLAGYMLMAFFLGLAVLLMDKGDEKALVNWYEQVFPIGYFIAIQAIFLIMIYNFDIQHIFQWYLCFIAMSIAALFFVFNYQSMHPLVLDIFISINLLLSYICILYTQSRGGYMGLFTGAVLFCLFAGRKWLFNNWKRLLFLGGIIFIFSAFTMLNPDFSPFKRFSSEIGTKQDVVESESKLDLRGAAGSRGETWKSAFGILADNPYFGVGPEVLKMVFPRYETDLFRFKEAFHVKQDRSHNETFDVGVTKGLIAFLVYVWLLSLLFWTSWTKSQKLSGNAHILNAGLIAAALAYLIQNQFSFGVVAITSIFWIIWAMLMNLGQEEIEKTKEQSISWQDLPWLSLAAILAAALVLIYISFSSFNGDILFKQGKTELQYGQLEPAAQHMEASLRVYPFEGGAISHLGIIYLNASRDPARSAANLEKAINVLKYGIAVDAYNADNFHLLSKIYLMLGSSNNKPRDLQAAQRYALICLKIDPYYAESYDVLGLLAEKQGDTKLAIENYGKAVMINPNLSDVMDKLDGIFIKRGDLAAKQAFLEKLYKKYYDNASVLERMTRYYINKGMYAQAYKTAETLKQVAGNIDPIGGILVAEVDLYQGRQDQAYASLQEILMKDPKNVPAYEVLAKYYLLTNDRSKAKETIDQILMLDPNNVFAKEHK